MKKILALVLVTTAAWVVLKDSYNIANGWMHPETVCWSVVYLSDDLYEKVGLSFNPVELKKMFWWEHYVDRDMTRLLSAFFLVVDAKFRVWLFQYIPPNPAISITWLFSLFLSPLLLFNFLKRYFELGNVGAAAVTVSFLASPATGSLTFMNFHPGKALAIFFVILALNIAMALNDVGLLRGRSNEKRAKSLTVLLGVTIFLGLYTDPLEFIVFLLLPLFFPRLFMRPSSSSASPLLEKRIQTNSIRQRLRTYSMQIAKGAIETSLKNRGIIFEFVLLVFLYLLALMATYSGYREYCKGYEHIRSHFIGEYIIDAPEISRALRHSIGGTFFPAIAVFSASLLLQMLLLKEKKFTLWGSVRTVFFTTCVLDLVFVRRHEALVVLNTALLAFLGLSRAKDFLVSLIGRVIRERKCSLMIEKVKRLYLPSPQEPLPLYDGSLMYLLYGAVIVGYSLSVFFVIPWLSDWSGYSYGFLHDARLNKTPLSLINPKFYMVIATNVYWLVIGGVGLRGYLPLYMNGDYLIISWKSLGTFLLFHLIFLSLCLLSYKCSSRKRKVLVAVTALYLTVGWITFVQAKGYFRMYLYWANYFYGSIFSVAFAILLGAVLSSYKDYKKIYIVSVMAVLMSSYFTYCHLKKEMNPAWKYGHYGKNIDIDGFYREYKEYWKEIKNNKVDFDESICKIDAKIHRDVYAHKHYPDFTNIAFNKDSTKAINFAAFSSYKDLKTSVGHLGYTTDNLEAVTLTEGGLSVSSFADSTANGRKLIDGDPETFWCTGHPRQEVDAFVELDLGTEREVRMVRVLPRMGFVDQLWDGRTALWEGSSDKHTWHPINALKVKRAKLKEGKWVSFILPEAPAYRYYRLRIKDPTFLSLAELQLFN